MQVHEAIRQRRSIRKFLPKEISREILEEIVSLARLYPSGANLQPIRFAVVTEPALRDAIFADLRWAAYLPEFSISPQERPTGYIIFLRDEQVKQRCDYDVGAASTTAMLAAPQYGLATCALLSFHRENLQKLLQLDARYVPELVLAVGYPAQESRTVSLTDSVKYTQDEQGNFSVPKWDTRDVLLFSR